MHRHVVQVNQDLFGAQGFKDLQMGFVNFFQLQSNDVQVQTRVTVWVLPGGGDGQVF